MVIPPRPPEILMYDAPAELPSQVRQRIHEQLLERLDLRGMDLEQVHSPALKRRAEQVIDELLDHEIEGLESDVDRALLRGALLDEVFGLGPLERLMEEEAISEVMVVGPGLIVVERGGRLLQTNLTFSSPGALAIVIQRIVGPLGRSVDEGTPLVDARLPDGSRVNVVIPPVANGGAALTIRKFSSRPLALDDLIGFGTLTAEIGHFLEVCVRGRKNIVVAGGTGSGKTTTLNVLGAAIPGRDRIVTIEDAAELRLTKPHVVTLEARPANSEGRGEVTIRDLVRNVLRMRPDRILVGECRGGEAADMLQAMSTGHDGSLTTLHANGADDVAPRLETLVMMAGQDLPLAAIRAQIASAIDLVVFQARLADGSRKVMEIAEVSGMLDGEVRLEPLYRYVPEGRDDDGRIVGRYRSSGFQASFLADLVRKGLIGEEEILDAE